MDDVRDHRYDRSSSAGLAGLRRLRGRRRLTGWGRALARGAAVALVVVLPVAAWAPAADAVNVGWPRVSLAGVRAWLAGSHLPPGPVQERGSAAGPAHQVPAAVTRAVAHAAGSAPGRGPGQLPPYAPHRPSARPFFTGPDVGDGSHSFVPGTSRLVAGFSTAVSDLYRNADGTYTRVMYTAPVNFQAAGGWRRIDTRLAAVAGGGWRERANAVGVGFAAAVKETNLASVDAGGGRTVSVGVAGAAPVAGTLGGAGAQPVVTYAGALPDADVALSPTAAGLRLRLLVLAPGAANWVLPLRLAGLTAEPGAGGTVRFVAGTGRVALVLGAPGMADARVSPVTGLPAAGPVSARLVSYRGQPAVQVSADGGWLAAPGREFPVTVSLDVGVPVAGPGAAVTQAVAGDPGVPPGGPVLGAGSFDAGRDSAATVLRFPAAPAVWGGAKVELRSAVLHLFSTFGSGCAPALGVSVWGRPATAPGSPPAAGASGPAWRPAGPLPAPAGGCAAAGAGGAWLQAPLTLTGPAGASGAAARTANTAAPAGATAPAGSTAPPGAAPPAAPGGAAAASEAGGAVPAVGLGGGTVAVAPGTAGGSSWQLFGSADSANPPYLALTATTDTPPQIDSQDPPSNDNVTSLTPELLASGHDPDGQTVQYVFTVYTPSGSQLATSGLISAGDWSVPSGKLGWNQTYYWTVQDYDGTSYSAAPQVFYFSTPVPQPLLTSSLAQNTGGQGFSPAAGNYTTSATDAQVSTVGPALSIERDYNSLDPRRAGAFGAAWSSVLDMRVAPATHDSSGATETMAVTYPDGQQVGFGKNANGSFTAPVGRYATLAAVTGGYTLTDKNDTVYTFTQSLGSGAYGITSLTDALGHALNFTWTSGQITQIASAVSGRALHVTWSTPSGATAAHVASVYTDPVVAGNSSTALTWLYGYTGDRLTQVCPPASTTACIGYAYQAGSDYQNAVLDAGPHSYWRLDETSGTTAASSVLLNEGADNATYAGVALGQPGPLPGSAATAAGFNGTSAYVQLPSSLVVGASYQTVSLWFKTTTAGGVLFSYSADPVTDASTPGQYTPSLYIGSDGHLLGEYWYSGNTAPAKSPSAVNDGRWHQVVLTGAGNTQTLYLDGTAIGTLSGTIKVTGQVTGQVRDYVGAGFLGGTWPDEPHMNQNGNTGYATFFNGSISDVSFTRRELTAAEVTAIHAAGTAQASWLTTTTRPSGSVYAQAAYNGVTGAVTSVTDDNGGTWQLRPPTVTGSSQVFVSSVLGADPADYYRLADTGTTQPVDQVNGGTAAYNNVTEGQPGPFSDSFASSFNGSSSYVALPHADQVTTGPGSAALWFKTTATSEVLYSTSNDRVTSATTPGNYTPSLYVGSDGKLNAEFWTGSAGQAIASAKPVNDGKWHYAVLSAGTSSQTLYVDGSAAATLSATLTGGGLTNVYAGAGFLGGGWPDEAHYQQSGNTGYASFFNGSIAEFAFYRSQLSAAQVTAQYVAAKRSGGLTPVQTATVTDPGGKTISYVMDALNGDRMLTQTDALGNTTTYGYDTGGFLYNTVDPNGDETLTGHDIRGNLVSQTSCQNQVANVCSTSYFSYYPNDTSAQLTPDPRNDLLLAERDAGSSSATDTTYLTSYGFDSKGQLTSITTPPVPGYPSGRVTTMSYTDGTTVAAVGGGYAPAGLLYKETTPGGAVTTTLYTANGGTAQVTDPDGLVTKYAYDGVGRQTAKTVVSDSYPGGLTTSYGYNQMGEVTSETDPAVTDRVTGAIHTAQTTTAYDPDGDVTAQTVADATGGDASRSVTSTYNSRDQITAATDATGATTSYSYDAYGNKVTETDPAGNVLAYAYDANGRLLTVTLQNYTGDPASPSAPANLVESSRAYDPAGRLASVTDSMGWVTSYGYTDDGLVATLTRTDPHTGATFTEETDSYNPAGDMTSQVTNNGATTTSYAVDATGRTTAQTLDPAGLDRVTSSSYTPDDQIAGQTVTGGGAATPAESTSYSYDPAGNMTSRSLYLHGAADAAGWWRLDQASGTAVPDASGTGHTATASNVTWSGGAGSFNGTSSQITTSAPVLDTTGSFSVSAWVDLASTSTYATVVGQDGTTNSAFNLQFDHSTGHWNLAHNDSDSSSSTITRAESAAAAATGTWTHLVGTYDSSTGAMVLYVNGQQSGTAAATTAWGAFGALTIGRGKWAGSSSDFVNGQIADVRAYQRVLSAAEVSALYQNGRDGTANTVNQLTTNWTLDQRGLPTSMTDPAGNTTHYAYDEAGNLAVTTSPTVSTQVYGGTPTQTAPVTMTGYNTFGEPVENSDANGNLTTVGYDAEGRPVSVTAPPYTPPGSSTAITAVAAKTYNSLGQITAETDPLGDKTTYTYDQLGDAATVTAPDGGLTHYTYDTNGDQLSATGPTGAVSQATYDYLGRQVTATDMERYPAAAAYTTSDSYGTGGWLSSQTSPGGVTTSYTYNAAGETASVTDGAGNTTSYAYDPAGRLVTTTNPDGTAATRGYDQAGRLTGQADLYADGTTARSSSSAYDGDGNLTAATDFRGNTTTFTYGATGLLASQSQPVSAGSSITTSFGYDAAGYRTLYTDGNGTNWWTTYNSWNLQESRIVPPTAAYPAAADGTYTTAYDANAEPVTQTQPGGVTTTSAYDSMGRLTGQSGSGADAPTPTRTFGYDTAGDMTSAATAAVGSTPATSETFTYNDRGLLLSAAGSAGSSSFAYNSDGQPTSATDAAGTTSYSYDSAGRLATLTDPLTGTAATYGYNRESQVNKISYGTGNDTRTFVYNSLHEVTSDTLATAGGQTVASIGYGYDENGNLTTKTTTGFAGASSNTYTYDEANRLTSWNNGSTTTSYAYDGAGNRTQVGNMVLTYDARDELIQSQLGNYAPNTMSYTARGTLSSATSGYGTFGFTADAYGQPVTEGVQVDSYDALGRMLSDNGFASSSTLGYVGTSGQIASDGSWLYTYDPAGTLAGVSPAGTTGQATLAYTDAHTDVVGDFAPAGTALTGSATYDPLGTPTSTASLAGSLGYQSGFTDTANSFVHMGARWYWPGYGVFTTRDTVQVNPVPDSTAANPFAYAGDDPMTVTDPTGHMIIGLPGDGGHYGGTGAWHPAWSGPVWYPPPPPPPPRPRSCGFWDVWCHVRHVASHAWHHAVNGYHRFTRWGGHVIHKVAHFFSAAIDRTISDMEEIRQAAARAEMAAMRAVVHTVRDVGAAVSDAASWGAHAAVDVGRSVVSAGAAVAHHVTRWAQHSYRAVVHVVHTAAHYVARAATATVRYVKHHAAAIASFAVSAVVFVGCDAALGVSTGGVGAIAGAAACGELAGAAGNAVGYGVTAAQTGKFSWSGLAHATATGAVAGAVGGALGGAGGQVLGAATRAIGGLLSDGAASAATRAAATQAADGVTTAAADDAGRGLDEAVSCAANSFTGRTRVLLASGAKLAISKIKPGQKVLATDPAAGVTAARTVAKVITHRGAHAMAALTLIGGAVIYATAHHPIWDATTRAFTYAADLHPGDKLREPSGHTITLASVRRYTADLTAYNLDVTGIHTYYVQAGHTAILVHNSCGGAAATGGDSPVLLGRLADMKQYIASKPEGQFDADFLNIRGTMAGGKKGVGGWNWTRNKGFIDSAIASGREIRLVTNPDEPLYQGGNTYQRELKYLADNGFGWQPAEDYWQLVRVRATPWRY